MAPALPRRVSLTAAAALLAASATACVRPSRPPAAPPPAQTALPDHIRVRAGDRIASIPLDDYVVGSVLAEVSPIDESEAVAARIFEIQAIVARTYAVSELGRHSAEGFDVCDTVHCQLYDPARLATSRFAAAARAAVARTRGRVLRYDGRVMDALFHSDCGGETTSADAVWGGQAVPYLSPVVDNLAPPTHRTWQFSATTEQLRVALNSDLRTAVGRRLDALEILSRDASGRAAGLGIRGERTAILRGDLVRAVLTRALGTDTVMSTRFTLARTGNRYVFTGTGFGHGVGLCQRGAAARVRRGESIPDILATYFPGATIN